MNETSAIPQSKQIQGADGNALRYLQWSGEGVPLLLLHGFGNEAHIWDELAPQLSPHYRVLAPDLRGHGESAHDPQRRYHWAAHVQDVEALMRGLKLQRVVLCGHSLGGRTALLYAGRNPERMAGLVVVDAGPEHDPRGQIRIQQEVQSRGEGASGAGSFARREDYMRLLARHYPAAKPAALARMAQHEIKPRADGRFVRKADPHFMTALAGASEAEQQAAAEQTRRELWRACETTPCPALVVRGAASDILSAEVAERMAQTFPQGRLVEIPQAAHSVMTDNPAAFNQAVCSFVLG